MVLTVFAIENAKPRDKVYRLSDGDGACPSNRDDWLEALAVPLPLRCKENMLTLGAFPDVGVWSPRPALCRLPNLEK